jgi:hypothetical protein
MYRRFLEPLQLSPLDATVVVDLSSGRKLLSLRLIQSPIPVRNH